MWGKGVQEWRGRSQQGPEAREGVPYGGWGRGAEKSQCQRENGMVCSTGCSEHPLTLLVYKTFGKLWLRERRFFRKAEEALSLALRVTKRRRNLHARVADPGTHPAPCSKGTSPSDLPHRLVASRSSQTSFYLTLCWHLTSQTTPQSWEVTQETRVREQGN